MERIGGMLKSWNRLPPDLRQLRST